LAVSPLRRAVSEWPASSKKVAAVAERHIDAGYGFGNRMGSAGSAVNMQRALWLIFNTMISEVLLDE
jgi:hypothetical protein